MSENKIAISKIHDDDVKAAVFQALDLINAKRLFTREGLKVLLKPNLLLAKEPEKAATTHPAVFRAVIQWIKQFNPEKIIAAESSGTQKRGVTEGAFRTCGLKDVCEEEGIEWSSFGKTPRKIYKVKNPLVLEEFSASTLLDEVDIIVNLPKIKTHGQCILTCSIKNMFGTLILGNKPKTHARFPKVEDFNAALADIYSVSAPQLTVIDGYLGMEGNGPSAGEVVKLDIILAGYDPVALDTTVCKIIDFDINEIQAIQMGEKRGLGTSDLKQVELLGEEIGHVKHKFKMPKSHLVSFPLPRFIAEYAGKTIFKSTIKFDASKCKLCGTCWKNCPVNAIEPPKELKQGKFVPKWDKDTCITCYCCAELCPYEAVDFQINIVKNVLTSWIGVVGIIVLLGIIWLLWFLISLFINWLI